MIRPLLRCLQACSLAAVLASAAGAQTLAPSANPPALADAPTFGPTRDAAVTGARPSASRLDARFATQARPTVGARAARRFGHSQMLMIVGGAAIVVGAVAGGDAGTVLVLGGAGVGGYGLYLYTNGR